MTQALRTQKPKPSISRSPAMMPHHYYGIEFCDPGAALILAPPGVVPKSHTSAIVGGAIGGVPGLALIFAVEFWRLGGSIWSNKPLLCNKAPRELPIAESLWGSLS